MMEEKKTSTIDTGHSMFQERLWKDYGKMVNRDSGIVDNKEDRTEHTTESRVCYRVMA